MTTNRTPNAPPPRRQPRPTDHRLGRLPLLALCGLLLAGRSARAEGAAPGQAAPDFALPDLDGKLVRLSDFRGKLVVLEWFNPECPFVRASHFKGSLVGLAQRMTARGVVWLAINSGAPGKQGAGVDKSRAGKAAFHLDHPVLIDESGKTGHAYGATNTPHIYVIGKDGVLAYKGAIDNSPDGEGLSPQGEAGKLVNYAESAVESILAGRPVSPRETRAYGCSVKYAN
jgi:peroxiredoxin